jgi:hypothetical protein
VAWHGTTSRLASRRLPSGSWPLDRSPDRLPFSFGRLGEPNKWVTLDALRVSRLLGNALEEGPRNPYP